VLLRCLIWEGPRGGGGDVGFVGGLALGGGQGEGLVAEGLDLPLDGGGVERGVLLGQSTLGQGLDLGVGGDPGVRGLGGVVLLGDLGAVPDLGDELLLRVEVVADQGLQRPDLVQQHQFCLRVVAQVDHQSTHRGPVLLLHVRAVVLVPRPRPGELQPPVPAVAEELVVDELAAVVRVDPADRERQVFHDVGQSREHVYLGLVAHRPVLRPAGGDVGHREGEAELPAGAVALVSQGLGKVVV